MIGETESGRPGATKGIRTEEEATGHRLPSMRSATHRASCFPVRKNGNPMVRLVRRYLLLGAAISFGLPAATGAQHFPADEDLRLMLRYLVEDGVAPGIVLGVLEAGGSTRMLSYGTGGRDTRPLSPRSVFDLGSINKTFTATLLAEMVGRGEVALEDPVAAYLPDSVSVPSLDGREITLLDLATHTSGLPRLPDNYRPPEMRDPYGDYTVEILYAFLSGHELRRLPGAEYEYSNLGYGLLGHALARAAGVGYRELLKERVLGPLGMDDTGYELNGACADWMVWGHKDGRAVPYWTGTEAIDGAGGLRASLLDMLTYLKANIGPPETALEKAMEVARESRGTRGEGGSGYGFSWGISSIPGRAPMITHGGGTGGFSTRIAFFPASGAATHLEDLLRFGPPPEGWGNQKVDTETLARYVGEYESVSGNSSYYVRLEEEGYLTYQPRGRSRARLYAKSDTTFYLLQGPWSFTFRMGGAGGAVEMWMEVDEREPELGIERTARKVGDGTPAPAVVAGNAGLAVAIARIADPIVWTVYGWGPVAWVVLGAGVLLGVAALVWRLLRRRRIGQLQRA